MDKTLFILVILLLCCKAKIISCMHAFSNANAYSGIVVYSWSVRVGYETPYRENNQYYIVTGSSIIFTCEHPQLPVSNRDYIQWSRRIQGGTIERVYDSTFGGIFNSLEGRATSLLTDTGHKLTITEFDVSKDAGLYECSVFTTSFYIRSDAINTVNNVYVKPVVTSLTLESLVMSQNILREGSNNVICKAVFSNSPDVSSLSFTLKVNGHLVSGSGVKTPSSGNSQSVTFKQNINIIRSDSSVQCELVWAKDKPVLKEILSTTSTSITVKFPPRNVTASISPEGGVVYEGTIITISCVISTQNPGGGCVWAKDGETIHGITYLGYYSYPSQYNGTELASSYRITAMRSDNNVVVTCTPSYEGQLLQSLTKAFVITVYFPHTVTVRKSPGYIIENQDITLTCSTTGGNPSTVDSYKWTLKHRYGNDRVLSATTKTIIISSIQYQDAGIYTCTASNIAGSIHGMTQVIVNFTPVDLSKPNVKVAYSEVNVPSEVNCTVLAYPVLTNNDVIIKKEGFTVPSSRIEVRSIQDKALIKLKFTSVSKSDFGNYTVIVSNSIGSQKITMTLIEKGPPEVPHRITSAMITARNVIIAWISGFSGGYLQTFQIRYREKGNDIYTVISSIPDPGIGMPVTFRIENLKDNTQYEFRVASENGHIATENKAISGLYEFSTLGIPMMDGPKEVKISGTVVSFTWPAVIGDFTKILIEKCSMEICDVIQNITNVQTTIITLSINDPTKYTYKLSVYQHSERVYSAVFEMEGSGGYNLGTVLGSICGVIAGIFMGIAICIIVQKVIRKCRKPKTKTAQNSSKTYENVLEQSTNELKLYQIPDAPTANTSTPVYAGLQETAQNSSKTYENVLEQSTNELKLYQIPDTPTATTSTPVYAGLQTYEDVNPAGNI